MSLKKTSHSFDESDSGNREDFILENESMTDIVDNVNDDGLEIYQYFEISSIFIESNSNFN